MICYSMEILESIVPAPLYRFARRISAISFTISNSQSFSANYDYYRYWMITRTSYDLEKYRHRLGNITFCPVLIITSREWLRDTLSKDFPKHRTWCQYKISDLEGFCKTTGRRVPPLRGTCVAAEINPL